MTIQLALIPSIKMLLQALSAGLSKAEPWCRRSPPEKSIQFYSRAMWALDEGVRLLLNKKNEKDGKVWLPDYFCNEALFPLRLKK